MPEAMNVYKSLEQLRAKHAWVIVTKVKTEGQNAKSFGMQAKKLPVRIMASGLGQAIAFLDAKKEAPALVATLNEWIGKQSWAKDATHTSKVDATLIQRIIENDSEFLRMATEESLALLQWIVRFAEAEGLLE